MNQWTLRILQPEDVPAYRDLRVYALKKLPHCFGESEDELLAASLTDLYSRIQAKGSFPEQFTLGAFDADELFGTISLRRETRTKYRHRAFIWGYFVKARRDRRAVGEALLSTLLGYAQSIEGLEQIDVQVECETKHDSEVYEIFGFKNTGRHPKFIKLPRNQYHDVNFYTLELKNFHRDDDLLSLGAVSDTSKEGNEE